MMRIKNNCKNLKYVKIPSANRAVTEEYPNCILMDYIEGIKITQIQKEDYDGFAKQVMKFGFVTSIVHGVTHGDLHGGNILFIKDNNDERYPYKIGVIDFGIVYDLDSKFKGIIFDKDMFVPPFVEKMFGMILHKIFKRIKQFIEKLSL